MKIIYVDIGELGWSLYLSAHVRWLKRNSEDHIGIMTLADRKCLYRGLADSIYDVPDDFHERFKVGLQSGFGLKCIPREELKTYFEENIPRGYRLNGVFICQKFFGDKKIFEPYSYSKKLIGKTEILVFPRHRDGYPKINRRNLSEKFYIKMIRALCDEFPDYTVRTMGILSGAYNLTKIERANYINGVNEDTDLQDLIDRCQLAIAAVGSQSAPPKISLLQDVPTFMIGHQRERHINRDNWMSTKVEFYELPKRGYHTINSSHCAGKIISFIKECQ